MTPSASVTTSSSSDAIIIKTDATVATAAAATITSAADRAGMMMSRLSARRKATAVAMTALALLSSSAGGSFVDAFQVVVRQPFGASSRSAAAAPAAHWPQHRPTATSGASRANMITSRRVSVSPMRPEDAAAAAPSPANGESDDGDTSAADDSESAAFFMREGEDNGHHHHQHFGDDDEAEEEENLADLDPTLSCAALYYSNDLASPPAAALSTADTSAVVTVLDPDDPLAVQEAVDAEAAYVDPDARPIYSKLFNAALLCLSFGFAFYTLIHVDAGMTRGWTQQEIALRVPLDAWTSYESSLAEKPILTKTIINVVIYLLGDWLSQTVFKGQDVLEFDATRTLRNGFIGMCFGPLVHQYYDFSDYILPVDVGVNRVYKILMDQTVYLYIKCSIYLVAVAVLAGEPLKKSVDETRGRINGVMMTAWKFWPLVHCITYTVIPAPHRVLWVNCVDLIWNAILASKASGEEDESEGDMLGEGSLDMVVMQAEAPIAERRTSGFDLAWLSFGKDATEEWTALDSTRITEADPAFAMAAPPPVVAAALKAAEKKHDHAPRQSSSSPAPNVAAVESEEESIMSIYGGGDGDDEVFTVTTEERAANGRDRVNGETTAAAAPPPDLSKVVVEILEVADGEGRGETLVILATNDTTSTTLA